MEVEVTPKNFGRIAAQTAKQAMMQRIRQVEKEMIYEEFKDRAGEIVSGTVRRFDRSDVILDLGKFEAIMPQRERVVVEDYNVGDRLRAYVVAVENGIRGPEIIVSRSHPNFVRRLFELEVSEINDGTVEIRGIAREAGYRTKIAVTSANEKVDPVGACVGMRGSRVKNIVRELNNEKVDIIRWSSDPKEFVLEALKPAKVKNLVFDTEKKSVQISVDEDQLSLAIGKKGQNARLTSRLTGWEINIDKDTSATTRGRTEGRAGRADALPSALPITRRAGVDSGEIWLHQPGRIARRRRRRIWSTSWAWTKRRRRKFTRPSIRRQRHSNEWLRLTSSSHEHEFSDNLNANQNDNARPQRANRDRAQSRPRPPLPPSRSPRRSAKRPRPPKPKPAAKPARATPTAPHPKAAAMQPPRRSAAETASRRRSRADGNRFADRREEAAPKRDRRRRDDEAPILPPISRIRATPERARRRAGRTASAPPKPSRSAPVPNRGRCADGSRGRAKRKPSAENHSHQAADHRQGSGDAARAEDLPAHQGADGD